MPSRIYKPEDLATYVSQKLNSEGSLYNGPDLNALIEFFEILFYTSLNSEEGELIKVTVTLFNPNPETNQPRKQIDRWRFVPFSKKVPFQIKTIVKLSKAANPWSSSLAVYFDRHGVGTIHGLIDQELHLQSYLNYENEDKPESPGILQASITGVGVISVLRNYKLLATLNQDSLIKNYLDVFRLGPISDLLDQALIPIQDQIFSFLKKNYKDENIDDWDELVRGVFRSTLARILNKIKSYHHGGAILLTDDLANLDIKYGIKYNRIATSMISFIQKSIQEAIEIKGIKDLYKTNEETVDIYTHNEIAIVQKQKSRAANELKGAIRFVASQGCVDGLILMNTRMYVKGFGVVITDLTSPDKIHVSVTNKVDETKLIEKNANHFGTRHRSMFAYCYENPGSIGFVISQDGDIRAITNYDGKVVVWENIKTQQFFR